MNWLVKFFRLSHGDRSYLIKTYCLLTLVRLGLWLFPFEKLWKALQKLGQPRPHPDGTPPVQVNWKVVRKVIWAVNWSGKLTPGGAKCLARALTVKVLLSRQWCPAEFRIGVAKTGTGALEAHAWIEVQGNVVMGQLDNLAEYTPMPSLPT